MAVRYGWEWSGVARRCQVRYGRVGRGEARHGLAREVHTVTVFGWVRFPPPCLRPMVWAVMVWSGKVKHGEVGYGEVWYVQVRRGVVFSLLDILKHSCYNLA